MKTSIKYRMLQINSKKIIAKEIVYFTLCLCLYVLYHLVVFFYNYFLVINIEKNDVKLKAIVEQKYKSEIQIDKKLKQQDWYFDKLAEEFDLSERLDLNSPGKVWIWAKDSIKAKWKYKVIRDFHKNIGFANLKEFESFLVNNSISSVDHKNLNIYNILDSQLNVLKVQQSELVANKIDKKNKKNIGQGLLLVLFALFYVARYLLYALIWSLKTLKE